MHLTVNGLGYNYHASELIPQGPAAKRPPLPPEPAPTWVKAALRQPSFDGNNWQFPGVPKVGDKVDGTEWWGANGEVTGVTEGAAPGSGWVALSLDDGYRQVVSLHDGSILHSFLLGDGNADAVLDYAAVQHGRPPKPPGASTEHWHKLGFATPPPKPPGPSGEPVPGGLQLTFPGFPKPETGRAKQAERDLAKAIKSNHQVEHKPGEDYEDDPVMQDNFGNTADTSIVDFADGSTWIRKRDLPMDEVTNEMLMSRVSDVLGAGAPEVIVRNDGEWQTHVPNAELAAEWMGGYDEYGDMAPGAEDRLTEMYTSDQGNVIGIMDAITEMADRHEGNWMVQHTPAGDVPVPIDMGRAFSEGTDSEFASYMSPASIDDAKWNRWRRGLDKLRTTFEGVGRYGDWQRMMTNFDALAGMRGEA